MENLSHQKDILKLTDLYIHSVFSETINPETITMPEDLSENGDLCTTKCKKDDGEVYHMCSIGKSWGYCTPGKFHNWF